ncbi:hypothetical protein H3146_25855 [Streptomyces sp. OF3]|uniref:Uncharacterized protein n=1 Tax=Streptomyces alkaliterrae TaxID=2213162 RepID=A0A5P0YWC4_9ACTN|nr:hypothetical protein [Streptomyces alkaliterrae]MBB1262276.1 hypothetical protein [Streptomyces alkaliterrae]MQS04585.1 hypothetical protein [Streptomyces alkaliterrae]
MLRREAPTTVALLPDERAFATMRRYRSFRFDRYDAYRRETDGLLRALAARTEHVRVTLLDPGDYARYCATTGTDPDTAAARARYTADRQHPVLTYQGQRLTELIDRLRAADAARRAGRRPEPDNRPDQSKAPPGTLTPDPSPALRDACDRAVELIGGLLLGAGAGRHHLVCSVRLPDAAGGQSLTAALHTGDDRTTGEVEINREAALALALVLAAGITTLGTGGVVLRSTHRESEVVHGWRLVGSRLRPLTTAEVFTAYCTDPYTGEPLAPEPGVEHRAGFFLPDADR